MSYDNYAGGNYEVFFQMDNIDFFNDDNDFDGDGEIDITQFQADILNALVGSVNINFEVEDTFGFIPTPSALDVGEDVTTLVNNDYFVKYNAQNPPSAPKNIPFDNFTTAYTQGSDLNEQHISFNTRNGNWLATELDNNTTNQEIFNCSYICKGAIITGTDQICHNTPSTYTVSTWPNDATFTWEISPSGGFTLNQNGKNVTVTPNGNFSGDAILTVTASNDCGTATSTKTIQSGAQRPIYYDLNGEEQASFSFCTTYYDNINFTTPFSALEWEWNQVSGNFNMLVTNNQAQFFSYQPTSGIVTVRARDNCGWSAPTFLVINFSNCSGGGGFGTFRMAQNPVNGGQLTVVEQDPNNSNAKNQGGKKPNNTQTKTSGAELQNVNFELYDFTGLLQDSWTEQRDTQNWDYSFDVSQYQNGNYFIRISCGDISEMYQIVIDN